MTTPTPQMVKKFKRGATFYPTCRLPITGSLTNLTGVSIASSVTTVDGKEWVCAVAIPDPTGRVFTLRIEDTVTAKWPVGDASWDMKFKLNGVTVLTETIIIRILKSGTTTML
jgi:hypothetical protein